MSDDEDFQTGDPDFKKYVAEFDQLHSTKDFEQYVAHFVRHSEGEDACCYPNGGPGNALKICRAPGSDTVRVLMFPSRDLPKMQYYRTPGSDAIQGRVVYPQTEGTTERPDPVVVETCPIGDITHLSRIIHWYGAFCFESGEDDDLYLEYKGKC